MDLKWEMDLDLFGGETSTDEEELEQDVMHILEQDRGTNPDDLDRGLGLANILSDLITPGIVASAEEELQKDDRVESASAKLTQNGGVATFDVAITVNDDVVDVSVPIGAGDGGTSS